MGDGISIWPVLINLLPVLAVLLLVGVPVIGLVVRYTLSPLIQDLSEAIRSSPRDEMDKVSERLARIELRLESQKQEIERLAEAERFDCELRSGDPESGDAVES